MNDQSARPGTVEDGGWSGPPGLGRLLVVSCSIGALGSFVLVLLGALAAGQEWRSAAGLGLFVAFWGGLGFGSMIGGVVYASGIEGHGPHHGDHGG